MKRFQICENKGRENYFSTLTDQNAFTLIFSINVLEETKRIQD